MATSQKSVTVYAATSGYVSSYSTSTYATARSGGTLSVDTATVMVGQDDDYGWATPARIICFEGFLTFDTSEIPVDATVDAVTIYLAISDDQSGTDFTLRAGTSWTPTLTTGDWVAGASLSAKTLCASKSTSGLATDTYYALTSETALKTAIAKGATTAILLWSSRHEAGTEPTSNEYVTLHHAASAYPPKLVITYTSEDSWEDEQSIMARPFTTRAAAAEAIARKGGDGAIIDWWYEPDGADVIARAELRATTAADVPRSRWYVVSRDTPGVSVDVSYDTEDTPDYVAVLYRALSDVTYRDGTLRTAYYPSTPTAASARVTLLNQSGTYMTAGAAAAYAQQYYTRASADAMSARITAVGGLRTVDGTFVPAPLICAGDWIDIADLIPRAAMPTYITGTSYDRSSATVTITTGGREQDELVVPGVSALPGELSAYYGYQAPQEEVNDYYDPGTDSGDPGTGTDPGDGKGIFGDGLSSSDSWYTDGFNYIIPPDDGSVEDIPGVIPTPIQQPDPQ